MSVTLQNKKVVLRHLCRLTAYLSHSVGGKLQQYAYIGYCQVPGHNRCAVEGLCILLSAHCWRTSTGPRSHAYNYVLLVLVKRSTLCLKKTGQLRIIWHNFTYSQRLVIIFGRERLYSIFNWCDKKVVKLVQNQLRGYHSNSSDLTHPSSEFLGWLGTACYQQGNNKRETIVGLCQLSRPKDCSSTTCCNFWHRTLFR